MFPLTCSTWRKFLILSEVVLGDEAGSDRFDALDLFRVMLMIFVSWCARLKWKKEKEKASVLVAGASTMIWESSTFYLFNVCWLLDGILINEKIDFLRKNFRVCRSMCRKISSRTYSRKLTTRMRLRSRLVRTKSRFSIASNLEQINHE